MYIISSYQNTNLIFLLRFDSQQLMMRFRTLINLPWGLYSTARLTFSFFPHFFHSTFFVQGLGWTVSAYHSSQVWVCHGNTALIFTALWWRPVCVGKYELNLQTKGCSSSVQVVYGLVLIVVQGCYHWSGCPKAENVKCLMSLLLWKRTGLIYLTVVSAQLGASNPSKDISWRRKNIHILNVLSPEIKVQHTPCCIPSLTFLSHAHTVDNCDGPRHSPVRLCCLCSLCLTVAAGVCT